MVLLLLALYYIAFPTYLKQIATHAKQTGALDNATDL